MAESNKEVSAKQVAAEMLRHAAQQKRRGRPKGPAVKKRGPGRPKGSVGKKRGRKPGRKPSPLKGYLKAAEAKRIAKAAVAAFKAKLPGLVKKELKKLL
ncbi:MAG TPA: hypothetical protein VNZ54_02535 [bacterium]|jgi:hypothetical protein|nr:hypothetical protein [bacterium]HXB96900.1 hypothetical protein [bacterium]HXC64584.1 hypothetical protein [bacterium]